MRLVHYYPRALVGDGGPTRAMWEWASATYTAGCEVAVLYDAELQAESPLRNPVIPIVPVKHTGAGRIRAPRRLATVLTPNDVLVLHSTYVPSNVGAAWSARRHGVPYIVMPHGGYNARARERRHRRKQVWLPVERALSRARAGRPRVLRDRNARRRADGPERALARRTHRLRSARWQLGRGDGWIPGLARAIRHTHEGPRPSRPCDESTTDVRPPTSADSRQNIRRIASKMSNGLHGRWAG